ncbi:MAG: DNA-directed RNA polymerase subunit L [Candidatus Woesearchaeota archaeon]
MEIKVIEKTKSRMVFELPGEGHSFCNALKKELWNDKHIKAAGYTIKHPLVGIPRIVLETDGSKTPEATLKDAAKAVKKKCEEFKKEFEKKVK